MLLGSTLSQLGKSGSQLPGALAWDARAISLHLCWLAQASEWMVSQSLAGVRAGQQGLDVVRGTGMTCM